MTVPTTPQITSPADGAVVSGTITVQWTVSTLPDAIAPDFIASGAVVYEPTVTAGSVPDAPVTVAPAFIASTAQVFAPTVTEGAAGGDGLHHRFLRTGNTGRPWSRPCWSSRGTADAGRGRRLRHVRPRDALGRHRHGAVRPGGGDTGPRGYGVPLIVGRGSGGKRAGRAQAVEYICSRGRPLRRNRLPAWPVTASADGYDLRGPLRLSSGADYGIRADGARSYVGTLVADGRPVGMTPSPSRPAHWTWRQQRHPGRQHRRARLDLSVHHYHCRGRRDSRVGQTGRGHSPWRCRRRTSRRRHLDHARARGDIPRRRPVRVRRADGVRADRAYSTMAIRYGWSGSATLTAPPSRTWRTCNPIFVVGRSTAMSRPGREAALAWLRDMAETTDPDALAVLADRGVVLMQTANPDGFSAGNTSNGFGTTRTVRTSCCIPSHARGQRHADGGTGCSPARGTGLARADIRTPMGMLGQPISKTACLT